MPRDSYFQDFGNPIRRELLPRRTLSLALASPDSSGLAQSKAIMQVVIGVVVVDVIDYFLLTFVDSAAVGACRGLLVAFASLGVFLTYALRCCAPNDRGIAILISIALPLAAGATLWQPAFPEYRWLHAGGIAYCYSRLLAMHWCRLCVTSPVPKSTAHTLLARWNKASMRLAAVPLGVAVVAWLCDPVIACCVLLAFGIAALLVLPEYRRMRNWKAAWSALGSWLTYQPAAQSVPGFFHSPAGTQSGRVELTVLASLVMGACLRDGFIWPMVVPSLVSLFLPVVLMQSVLAGAAPYRRHAVRANDWNSLVTTLRSSANPVERKSYYMARVVADRSPVLVPRSLFGEHAHFLGDSGSGKTSLGLAPFIEQTIQFGDASVIVIDLKADTLELLATMMAAAKRLRNELGIDLPLKYLTTRDDLSTFAFNPMMQTFWHRFNSFKKTDLLNGATGLKYEPTYGADFYTAVNDGVVQYTYKSYPDVKTFDQLADRCGHVLVSADKRELHSEIRKNGAHVHEVLKRLASFPPLNVAPGCGFPDDVIEKAIDLADVFRKPQLLYFHLSSILGPGSAPALARFVCYFLLASASQVERTVPVYLVIDEFQRMAAQNFEYMLQLARSMGVGIILANQSMEDLKKGKIDLIPAIEANCRYRQWFAVSSSADRERLARTSGETIEYFTTRGSSTNSDGKTSTSHSISERVMPRLSANDIMLASDHPKQSIVHISRGAGYAQYGGLPVICESDFHISQEEYDSRRRTPWPNRQTGTFIPDEMSQQPAIKTSSGPIVTTEVVGASQVEDDDPFADLRKDFSSQQSTSAKNRKRRR